MRSDCANASEKAGMQLVEEHGPGLYSLRSVAHMVACFLALIVLAHLINQIGWWMALISAAAWNVRAFYLMPIVSWDAERIRGVGIVQGMHSLHRVGLARHRLFSSRRIVVPGEAP